MKIAILLPSLGGGGAERASIDLAASFTDSGHRVVFILMNAVGEYIDEASSDYEIFNLNSKKIRNTPLKLAKSLKIIKPDVLIANMWPLTIAAVLGHAISGIRCKLLLVDHTTLSRAYNAHGYFHNVIMRLSMRIAYPKANYVAGVSLGAANDVECLAGLPKSSVKILHNPVPHRVILDPSSISNAENLWKVGRGARILTVGNLKDAKNHQLLLRAFAQIAKPTSILMFVGRGPNEQKLKKLAQNLGITDRVVFAGFQADPSPFYATADLFVLSSNLEGLSNVIIEALSFGLKVVSTNCPSGPAEILENGRLGKLTPVGDVEALAKAIDDSLSSYIDPALLMSRASNFSPSIAANNYLELFGHK